MPDGRRSRGTAMSMKHMSTVLGVALLWLLVATVVAWEFWPHWPESWLGWIAMALFGPPVYVLAEVGSAWLWSKSDADEVPAVMRIGVGVVIGGLFVVLLFALSRYVGT
jgi:hypothetical protein